MKIASVSSVSASAFRGEGEPQLKPQGHHNLILRPILRPMKLSNFRISVRTRVELLDRHFFVFTSDWHLDLDSRPYWESVFEFWFIFNFHKDLDSNWHLVTDSDSYFGFGPQLAPKPEPWVLGATLETDNNWNRTRWRERWEENYVGAFQAEIGSFPKANGSTLSFILPSSYTFYGSQECK